MPKMGFPCLSASSDQTDFVTEPGKPLLLIDALGSAHDNQAGRITDFLGNALFLEGTDVILAKTGPFQGLEKASR